MSVKILPEVRYDLLSDKVSHFVGDSPRDMVSGSKFKDAIQHRREQSPLAANKIEGIKETEFVSKQIKDVSTESDKPQTFIASVDAEIAWLDVWLTKYPVQDSNTINVRTYSITATQDTGSKGTIDREDLRKGVKTDRTSAMKSIVQLDTRKVVSTDSSLVAKGIIQMGTTGTESTRKSISIDSAPAAIGTMSKIKTGREDLSGLNLKDFTWQNGNITELEDSYQTENARAMSSQYCDSTESVQDSKGDFDHEKFIRELDDKGFGNIASTGQKIPNVQEAVQTQWDSKERQIAYKSLQRERTEKDSQKGEKEYRANLESTKSNRYLLKQEQKQTDALDAREQEIAKAELELKRRQDIEDKLQQMGNDSKLDVLIKMKAERQRKEALLKAKEDELRRKKLDFDRLEIK